MQKFEPIGEMLVDPVGSVSIPGRDIPVILAVPPEQSGKNVEDAHGSLASAQELIAAPRRGLFRRTGYVCLNVFILLHVIAIVSAPLTVGPSSPTSRRVWDVFSPYLQAMYLNHGFHYFAPEPGSSNLVSWTVTREDGSSVSGRFPNFDIAPRLMYHRHFMLSEVLGNSSPDLQPEIVRGFARNLLREHDGVSVSLSTIRHELSSMPRIRAGGRLTDPDLYTEQPWGSFTREDVQ